MYKILSIAKIIVLSVFLLSYCNLNFLYGEENDSDSRETLKIKIVEGIGRLGGLKNKEAIDKFKGIAQEKDKLLKLYSMEILYKNGEKSYLSNILEFLDDADPEIRIKTLEVIGGIKNKYIQDAILHVFKFDRDYYVRIAAVDMLVALDSKDFLKELFDVLVKREDDVKQGAVFALSSLADSPDTLFLKQLLKDTKHEDYINRAYCAEALLRLGDTLALDALLKDLDDKNNSFRLLTAESLGNQKAGNNAAIRYATKLKVKDLHERILVIRILGKLAADNTLPIIIEQAKDGNEFIRKEAALALSDFKNRVDPAVLEALFALLNDNSEEVRAQAAASLGALYEKKVLEDILDKDPASDEAKNIFSLSMKNGEKAAIELKKLLKDVSKKVKSCVITSLGLLEDKDSALFIAEELYNDDALIRQATAIAIGRIKNSSVASRLISLFNDPDKNVQVEAVKAAGLLGDRNLLTEVLKKSGSNDIDLEAAVLASAFQLGDSLIVDKCIDGIKKGDAVSKIAGTQALGYMEPTEKIIEALIIALNDKNPLVRMSGIRSLRLLESGASLPNIINMLMDRDREVRVEACQALQYFKDHQAVAMLKKLLE